MTDYRPLLSKIVRLADRGTFSLHECRFSCDQPSHRWQAACSVKDDRVFRFGKSPGIAVRKLLAMLEKNAAAGRARRGL